MHKLYWLPILLAVGLVAAQSLRAKTEHQGGEARRPAVRETIAAEGIFPASIEHNISRIAQALESANNRKPSNTDERNAKAQEDVAWWTPWLFGIAALEMLVTATGVWLVYRTLIHTKRAADAASQAVTKAQETMEQAERHARQELRAYVNTTRRTATWIGDTVTCEVVLKNAGQTPAYKVAGKFRLWLDNPEVPTSIHQVDLSEPWATGSLEPGGEVSMCQEWNFEPGYIQGLRHTPRALWCNGLVKYTDAFEKDRTLSFRFYIRLRELSEGRADRMSFSLEGNVSD